MQTLKAFIRKYRYLLVIGGLLWGGYVGLTNLVSIEAISAVPQATIIRARNGEELFRFFEEDRRWIGYDAISKPMVNAIIAAEDKNFRENNGTDMSSLGRAIRNNMQSLWSDVQLQGGSTITQQLIKNVFLSKKKTISRKFQELILARYLTQSWTDRFKTSKNNYDQAFKQAKQEIMAAYLNIVYFGNHAYGIESAAQNYFGISAKQINLTQASILASFPQAPSLYNPSQNSFEVLGYRDLYSGLDISQMTLMQTGENRIFEILSQKSLELGNDCLGNLEQRATIDTTSSFTASYKKGRKDRVLCRMYELGKLTPNELKQGFLGVRDLKLKKPHFLIKAPHFVFRLQQYLLNRPEFAGYDEQSLARAGFDITTTLDIGKQQQAEDAISNYMGSLRRLGGNNRSLLHISTSGEILSYVGSADYFDREILGQNDLIQSKRQIGSTIKPFLYAYLLQHYPLAIDGAIVDAPIQGQTINNHDMQFRGKITIAEALASSRNLPVVRLYMSLGGDKIFVPYLQSLGFTLSGSQQYNYPLALGAIEVSMMQLGQAYLQLASSQENIASLNPILSIKHLGRPLSLTLGKTIAKIIPTTIGDMIWNVLSTKGYMPSDWYWLRNHRINNFALKTGTTDKKIGKKLYPRDGRSVLYTSRDVILSRAGNTSGKEMGSKAFGGEINHQVLRQYIVDLVTSGTMVDETRISNSNLSTGGRYAKVDHQDISKDMSDWLWRFQGTFTKPVGTGGGDQEELLDDVGHESIVGTSSIVQIVR